MIVVVMGVAGSGKTTVGSLLASELGWRFFDADDFHPETNREKMSKGIPLNDDDRASWLGTLRELIRANLEAGTSAVLACSALKDSYRVVLKVDEQVKFVYLKGAHSQIEARLQNRMGHFMTAALLASQFQTLEEPKNALVVDITSPPREIIQHIRKGLVL